MEGWTMAGQCSRCTRTGELFWLRKSLVCRECIGVNIVTRQDTAEPSIKSPGFYRSEETFTLGITCPDCEEPDNLLHSVCIEGMDLLATVKISHVQYVVWIDHRRSVHGEDL